MLQIDVGVVAWINRDGPWPMRVGDVADQALKMRYQPQWLPKTYIGLMGTSNHEPKAQIANAAAFEAAGDFRGMVWARLRYPEPERGRRAPVGATLTSAPIANPGFTAAIDTSIVPVIMAPQEWARRVPGMSPQDWRDLAEKGAFAGEKSPISGVSTTRVHPNSTLGEVPTGEALIASGLMKFRAGGHTDAIGIRSVLASFHVPWVWAEFLLTSTGGRGVRLRLAGSIFPCIVGYLGGQRQGGHWMQTDASFPTRSVDVTVKTPAGTVHGPIPGSDLIALNEQAMKIWPVLSAGAPRSKPLPPAAEDVGRGGPVSGHPYTCNGFQPLRYDGVAGAV